MSDMHNPQPPLPPPPAGEQPPLVIPVRYPTMMPRPAPVRGSFFGSMLRSLLMLVLAASLGLNVVLVLANMGGLSGGNGAAVHERFVSGSSAAKDKIAIIQLDGVIMEGALGFVQKEIDRAAADENVKAVVVRIVSPGGSITASDDLHKRIKELADGKNPKQKGRKVSVVVSMGALAASGGYYVAMPAEYILAERTTITGSIGVYAAFPNVAGLAKQYGFGMTVIKAGDIKDSGSMFHTMTAQERQLWQDMVDHAYGQFISVVEDGRPALKGKMTEVVIKKEIPDREPDGKLKLVDGKEVMVEFVRRRADGGIYTADEALKFGLIDAIGYQDDAVQKAKSLAGLGDDYKVITYDRPPTFASMFLGAEAKAPPSALDANKLAEGACPRLWFLAPQSELSGLLTAIGR